MSELYVNGKFTEDREEGQKALQRHCEEVYPDHDETREAQEKRIFPRERRTDTSRTMGDLVLQARAKMSQNKVNGPEDAVVSEMIQQLPQEKIYIIMKCFQERFMGQMEAPSSWKIVKRVFFRKPRCGSKERV